MLPMFIALASLGLIITLGFANTGTQFIYREELQQYADQLVLKSASSGFTSLDEAAAKLADLPNTSKLTVTQFETADSQTRTLTLCGNWWQQRICVSASAR